MTAPNLEDRLIRIESLLERRSLFQRVLRLLEVAIIPLVLGYLVYAVNDASNRIAEAQLFQAEQLAEDQLARLEIAAEKQVELAYTKIYFEHILSADESKRKRGLDLLIPLAKSSPGGARVAALLVDFVKDDETQSQEIRRQATRVAKEIRSWSAAKRVSIDEVYLDQRQTFYCGCTFEVTGRSSGRIDPSACFGGTPNPRATRLEWEHIVPASYYYWRGLPCWDGDGCTGKTGRMCCESTDSRYKVFVSDLHNMVPAVGAVNAARSAYLYAEVVGGDRPFGTCDIEIDKVAELVDPPLEVRGDVARIWLYISEEYNLPEPRQDYTAMLMRWHEEDPVSEWELERDRRIAAIQGRSNYWVTSSQVAAEEGDSD